MRLRELYDRVGLSRERYWEIPKETRIKYGLRPPVMVAGYSSIQVMDLAQDLLTKAFRGTYPITAFFIFYFFVDPGFSVPTVLAALPLSGFYPKSPKR